ncbi:MAG: Aspartyl/glutamyl-tRNA(Asn/Gln) amidotransferase subunit C [Parcubacteria group bacterium GW2011_GWC2_42_6]|nr:MAG: Aspartyl/glutamyl-tRNA(Asn/Gln) amidotransferase subunit C [Parcubacteria group bacterium GW2011_GWC2_42_6]
MDINHIAKLARIGLSELELKKLEQELAAILGFVNELNKVDDGDIEPMTQATGLKNIMRADEAAKSSAAGRAKLLANAPEKLNGYIKVKAVFE